MRVVSSADRPGDMPPRTRAGMVLLGFVPLLHASASIAPIVFVLMERPRWLVALTPVVLYLLPPLLVRTVTIWRPLPTGAVEFSSASFLEWWFTMQCQVVFARLPALEELMRLVPTLYSAWLRLWGSKIGGLVYWSPGVAILDRSLLDVGNRVAFGAGVRLNPHVLAQLAGDRRALVLAPITIGDDALIGGYSTLLPGCVIAAGEATPPFRSIHAFTLAAGGRRSRLPTMSVLDDFDAMAG